MLSKIISAEILGNFASKLRWGSLAKGAEMSPPPMWKVIGTPASCAAAQRGSQCGSDSDGSPYESGWLQKFTPLWPFSTQRSSSVTAKSRSQKGVDITGISRDGSAEAHSTRKSLYARTHAVTSSRSPSLRKYPDPNPATFG